MTNDTHGPKIDESRIAARSIALSVREAKGYLHTIMEQLAHLAAYTTDPNYSPEEEELAAVCGHYAQTLAYLGHALGELDTIPLDADMILEERGR